MDKQKDKIIAFLITYFFGMFGVHKFLKGDKKNGVIYLCTIGLFGVGWLIDSIKAFIFIFKEDSTIVDTTIDMAKKHFKKQSIPENNYEEIYKNYVHKEFYQNAYIERKTRIIPSSYIVFDTETTGLEVDVEKIIELSAIKYINHRKVATFNMLVNPQRKLDPFITTLTGIKQSDLSDKEDISTVLPKFYNFIEDYTLIAHNAPFDIKMLACEAHRCGIPLFENKIIDTVTLAKRIIPKETVGNYKLTTLKDYFGLSNTSHRALDDCESCAAVYQYYCKINGNTQYD